MRALISDPNFRTGLGSGLAGVALVGVAAAVLRSRGGRPRLPLAGLALVVSGVSASAIAPDSDLDPAALQAIGLAAIGGIVATLGRFRAPLVALAYAPGAIRLAMAPQVQGAPGWVRWVAAGVAVAAGALLTDFDRRHRSFGLGMPLFVAAVGGAYSTLPDTELVAVMLGAAIPYVAISIPVVWETIGAAGAGALCSWYGWVVWVDGRGRPGAVVGAVCALGLLVAEPIARQYFELREQPPFVTARRPVLLTSTVVASVQCVIALAAGRIAGLQDEALSAVVLAVPILVVAGAVGLLIPRHRPLDRTPKLHDWREDRYRR